jgi:hypothetical protein
MVDPDPDSETKQEAFLEDPEGIFLRLFCGIRDACSVGTSRLAHLLLSGRER